MLDYARKVGVDVDTVLRSLELSPTALSEFDRRIPLQLYAKAWIEASQRSRDPAFGLHAGIAARITDFDVLGYSLFFSATLGDALEQVIRFHRVLCDGWSITREDTPDGVRFRRVARLSPPDAEAACAVLVVSARELTAKPIVPHYVRFAHPAPADTKPHQELFGCPVQFGTPATEFEVETSTMSFPVRSANPGALKVLERYMTKDLATLPRAASVVEHVRSAIAKKLREGHRPSLGTTARELQASPRTLQRRLVEHGTTHSELVDAVRRDLADRLLAEGRLSITEVAFLAGFEDVSGFRRKYRSWTGHSPSRRRRRD